MDGLMFNTEDVYYLAFEEMGTERGKTYTKDMARSLMGRGPLEGVAWLKGQWGLAEDAVVLLQERNERYSNLVDDQIRIMDGLSELLDALERIPLRKAVVTSAIGEIAERHLNQFRLRERFELVVTADHVIHAKPDPEIYQLAMRQMGLEPGTCLVLEDSENGIRSGKAAGCHAIAIPNPFNREAPFPEADAVVGSLKDILPLFPFPA